MNLTWKWGTYLTMNGSDKYSYERWIQIWEINQTMKIGDRDKFKR